MINPFKRSKSPETVQASPEERARARQEAIDSFLASKKLREVEIEEAKNADLAGLSEEERNRKIAYRAAMDKLASEARKNDVRHTPSGDNIYLRYMAQDTSDRWSRNAVVAGTIAASLVIWGGAVSIAASSFDAQDGQQYLEEMGYSDINQTGTSYLFPGLHGCGTSDLVAYQYETTAVNGVTAVDMIVCTGLFKNATARRG